MDKAVVGKAFKKNAKIVTDAVAKMEAHQVDDMENAINSNGYFALSVCLIMLSN